MTASPYARKMIKRTKRW